MELSQEQLQEIVRLSAEVGARTALTAIAGDNAELVADAARAGAEALRREQAAIRRRERARVTDRRLHNTRLLLKNYRALKEHFQNAVYTFEEDYAVGELKAGDIWKILNQNAPTEELYIESICKSATRTMIIIQHIDRMLGIYTVLCERSPMPSVQRQLRVFKARYLAEEDESLADIAEREFISTRTAERDLNLAIETITALLFGIDAINDLTGRETSS